MNAHAEHVVESDVTLSERNAEKVFAAQELLRRLLRMHADHWSPMIGLFRGTGTEYAWQKKLIDHLTKEGIIEEGRSGASTGLVYRLKQGGTRLKTVVGLLNDDDCLHHVAIDMKPISTWVAAEPKTLPDVPEESTIRPERAVRDSYVRSLLDGIDVNLSSELLMVASIVRTQFKQYTLAERAEALKGLTAQIAKERDEDKHGPSDERLIVNALKGWKSTEVAAKLVGISMWTYRQAINGRATPVVAPLAKPVTEEALAITPPPAKGKIRIPFDVTEMVYDRIKAAAVRRNMPIQRYLMSLVESDGALN